MIKDRDLRIGNLVQSTSTRGYEQPGIIKVISIGEQEINSFQDMGASGGHYYSTLSGIPLTPEWLTKCGFELKDQLYYNGLRLSLGFVRYDPNEPFIQMDSPFGSRTLRFVHDLQNWFHSQTGQELEIKL